MDYDIGHQFSWYRGDAIRSNMSDNIDIYYCKSTNYRAFKINRNIIGEKNLDYTGDYSFLKGGYGIYFLYKIEQTSKGQTLHIYVGKAEDRNNPHGMDRLVEHITNDEKLGMKYHNKWNKALYITVKEDKDNPEFTSGIVTALESQFIQMFKGLDETMKLAKDTKTNIICYNSKIGGKSNESIANYKTSIYAIIALLCHSGIGIIPDKAFKKFDDEVRAKEFEYKIEEINQLKTELATRIKDIASTNIDKSVEDNAEYLKFKVADRFKKALDLYRDLGVAIINDRVYSEQELLSLEKSSNVLTREDIAKDMFDLVSSKYDIEDKTYLIYYSKDGIFAKVIMDKLAESIQNRTRHEQMKALRNLVGSQLFIIAPTAECYNLSMKTVLSRYSDIMANIDSGWALDIDNLILPNIIKINNMNNLIKTLDGRMFIREQIEKEFKTVKFDVVIGNPPYNNDLYLDFVTLGDRLAKEATCMITPAKWQAKGGEKNEAFRKNIVPRMSDIVYYKDTKDVFDIGEPGGISIILADKQEHPIKMIESKCIRNKTLESDWEEHDETTLTLLPRKILNVIGKVGQLGDGFKQSLYVKNTDHGEISIDGQLGFKRFTYTSEQERGEALNQAGYVEVMQGDKVVGYKSIKSLFTTANLDKWKCIQSCMPVQGSSDPFNKDTGKALGSNLIMVIKPYQVPKGSFQILKYFDSENSAESFRSYINSKTMSFMQFFGLCGATMTKEFFRFIPDPKDWSCVYVDAPHPGVTPDKHGKYEYNGKTYCSLYYKYNLTQDEINIIESVIKERK